MPLDTTMLPGWMSPGEYSLRSEGASEGIGRNFGAAYNQALGNKHAAAMQDDRQAHEKEMYDLKANAIAKRAAAEQSIFDQGMAQKDFPSFLEWAGTQPADSKGVLAAKKLWASKEQNRLNSLKMSRQAADVQSQIDRNVSFAKRAAKLTDTQYSKVREAGGLDANQNPVGAFDANGNPSSFAWQALEGFEAENKAAAEAHKKANTAAALDESRKYSEGQKKEGREYSEKTSHTKAYDEAVTKLEGNLAELHAAQKANDTKAAKAAERKVASQRAIVESKAEAAGVELPKWTPITPKTPEGNAALGKILAEQYGREGMKRPGASSAAASGGNVVSTKAQFDALPSGSTYTGKDGKTYRKP